MKRPRITQVELHGFKHLHRSYDIGDLTALNGAMGAGKSACVQAIRFAFTGEVEDGKKDEVVASWFDREGGYVVVYDDDGAWLKRGVRVDLGRKAKVTRILETSDTKEEDPKPNLSRWVTNPLLFTVVDGGFDTLSAEEKRRYVLNLCGEQSRPDFSRVLDSVALAYARSIGGRGAEISWLDDRDKWTDFEPDDQNMFEAWSAPNGVLETLQSHSTRQESISRLTSHLVSVASREQSAARANAAKARGAVHELEAEAEKSRAFAERRDELERRWEVAKSIKDELGRQRDERVRLLKRREAITKELESLGDDDKVSEDLDQLSEPDHDPEELDRLRGEISRIEAELSELDRCSKELAEGLKAPDPLAKLSLLEDRLASAKESLTERESSPIEELRVSWSALVEALGETPGPLATRHQKAVDAIVSDHVAKTDELRHQIEQIQKQIIDQKKVIEEYREDRKSIEDELSKLDVRRFELKDAEMKLRRELREKEEQRRLAERSRLDLERKLSERESSRRRSQSLRRILSEIEESLANIDEEIEADYSDAERASDEAQLERDRAIEECAKIEAYETAVDRLRRYSISERAWKIALQAIKQARETLVFDATGPIKKDMDRILKLAGRSERVYLRLENERGTPTFDMGLLRGESRISVGPLSGGESTLFLSALAVAIAMRSEGFRLIPIEADRLDDEGLMQIMTALSGMAEFANFVLCTSRALPNVDGWDYVVLGAEEVDGPLGNEVDVR